MTEADEQHRTLEQTQELGVTLRAAALVLERAINAGSTATLALEKDLAEVSSAPDPLGCCPCCWVLALVWPSRDAAVGGSSGYGALVFSASDEGGLGSWAVN